MCFNQIGDISTLNSSSLSRVDKFTYLGSSVSSSDTDINTRLGKTWTAIDRLLVIWKSVSSKQLSYWYCYMDALRMEKNVESNYTRMLRAILNKSWRQHSTKQQLCSHLPPITKTIKVRRTRHAWYCWRSRDDLISDVLLWTPSNGRAKAGRPARTYIQQLCADTGCSVPQRAVEYLIDM